MQNASKRFVGKIIVMFVIGGIVRVAENQLNKKINETYPDPEIAE